MANDIKKMSYLNRNFDDYRKALIEFSKKYYPDMAINYDDASIGSWLIDLNADVADNLSYHIDRVFQETNINTAAEASSLYALARNNGYKVPGPKGAMAEVEFTCSLPVDGSDNGPDWSYAPIIRRGTKVSAGSQIFEVLDDIDFSLQFDNNGNPDRTITPKLNSNSIVVSYKVSKLAVVIAGESKIFKKTVTNRDIVPFMEVVLPDNNVMNVESIVTKDGTDLYTNPTYGEFYSENEVICEGAEDNGMRRFFEVESLSQQKIWGVNNNKNGGKPFIYGYVDEDNNCVPTYSIVRGEWKNVNRKFITEYTDNGLLKVIFGSGIDEQQDSVDISDTKAFSKFQIKRVLRNDSLGYLPKPDSTIFILYRIGGGKASNVAKGAINRIVYLNSEIGGANKPVIDAVRKSITVRSTTPSVSGKDMPTPEELKYLIKYNKGSQNRCVTVKDYVDRVLEMPPKFGTPFRISASEENNKIMLYLLGLNSDGKLDDTLPTTMVENIRDYLSEYRTINDYVEIKSGKIFNLSFDIEVFIDKNYNKSDVIGNIITKVQEYTDINKHDMGDDMFIGDLKREVSNVDGVLNLINISVYNVFSGNYSKYMTTQETIGEATGYQDNAKMIEINLDASDYVIQADNDSMLEIKYPEKDIRIRCKTI